MQRPSSSPELGLSSLIHRSTWKGCSANFAYTEFCEVRFLIILGSSFTWSAWPETWLDLPVILDTLAAMDAEAKALKAEEAARLDAERKRRRNARARERRKLKKLGEW